MFYTPGLFCWKPVIASNNNDTVNHNPGADLGGVTRVTSHPPGAADYFMLLSCMRPNSQTLRFHSSVSPHPLNVHLLRSGSQSPPPPSKKILDLPLHSPCPSNMIDHPPLNVHDFTSVIWLVSIVSIEIKQYITQWSWSSPLWDVAASYKDGLLHGLIRRALGFPGGFSGWWGQTRWVTRWVERTKEGRTVYGMFVTCFWVVLSCPFSYQKSESLVKNL